MKKFFLSIGLILGFCFLLFSCSTQIEEVNVTYHTNTNTNEIIKNYERNSTISSIDLNLTKEGYEFEGWYLDESLFTKVNFPYTFKEDTHFYAKWIKLYQIVFMIGTEVFETTTVKENQTITTLPIPTKNGKTFIGWYTDELLTNAFDKQQEIKENTTLYAKFEDQKIEVIFKDGNEILKQQTISSNQTIPFYEAPIKEGYTFKGWSTKENEYTAYDFNTKLTSNLILYAFYEDVQISVFFKVEDTLFAEEKIKYNTSPSTPTQNPTKEGHTFVGWYAKDSSSPFDFSTKLKESVTLYANFEINTYSIHFKDGDQTLKTETIEHNSLLQPYTPAVKEGYTFKGWSTKENEYVAFDFNTKITSNMDLYAHYEIIKYTITYFVNETIYQTQTVNYNTSATAPTPPKIIGGIFEVWCTDETLLHEFDFTTNILENKTLYARFTKIETFTITFKIQDNSQEVLVNKNDVVSPIHVNVEGYELEKWIVEGTQEEFDFETPITKNITLVAVLKIKTYTVIFMDDTTILLTQTVNYNETASAFSSPSKEGHTFKGWSLQKETYEAFDFTTKIKENTILYAFYDVHEFTVQFVNEEVLWAIQKIKFNTLVTKPSSSPNKTGYKFIGWFTTENEVFDFSTKIKSDLTLIAKYEIEKYTVTFKDGTTTINTQTVLYNEVVSSIADPIKEGHTFVGWSIKENEYIEFNFTTKITSNLTLYAHYDINKIIVTFKNGTTIFDTKEVLYNTVVTPPTETPTSQEEGKAFVGWFYDDILFDFNTKITEAIELIAHFEEVQIEITSYKGYNEGLFFEATPLVDTSAEDYVVNYKLSSSSSWNKVDQELIRLVNGKIRCDVVGLLPGSYQVKIEVQGKTHTLTCKVSQDDRSGYAHFDNTSGVGAYNNDGTLKSNAVVVYVTDSNKNTVKAKIGSKEYTGLANIMKACTNSNYALNIRILGEIQTTQWNFMEHGKGNTSARQENLENTFKYTTDPSGWDTGSSSNYTKLNEKEIISKGINSMSNDEAKGITKLNGLTNQVLRAKKASSEGNYEYDSYYNMLEVDGGYNITVEGIGTDASIFQWGFTFKKSNSIEIKNLRFYNYTEDAVGFEGSSGKQSNYGNYWIHNCTFDLGVNNWDVCYENDKKDGDGSTDVKYCHNVTISYTQYNKTHKTNLIGSSDSAQQYNITLHHNYYNVAGSRLPLVRQANIHIYNNYYYKSSSYSHSIRANCFAFVENCYYEGGQNPYEVVTTSTYKGTAIKSFNNVYNNVKLSGSSYKAENNVTARTQTISGDCKPNGEIDYTNFDTNSSLFYYKNNASDVSILLDPADVPEFCKTRAGVLKSNPITGDVDGGGTTEPEIPENPDIPEDKKTVISFNDLTPNTDVSGMTINGVTFKGKSGKTLKVATCDVTLGGYKLNNSINLSGAGSFNELSIGFTISKKANITVYYANGSSNASTAGERFAMLCSSNGNEVSPTPSKLNTDIVSYTFQNKSAGEYAIGSKSSGLYIYLIIIEYLE